MPLKLLRNPRVEKYAAHVWWFQHALERIATEFKEISREAKGRRHFRAIVYLKPITVAQRKPLLKALKITAGSDTGEWLDVAAVPRESGVVGIAVDSASADGAAMVVLTLVRTALHELDMTMTRVRVEVEEEA